MQKNTQKKGFTIIEIMVAVTVFTFIMFISMGSILSVFDANRKSQNIRAVMDNLNYAIEAMTRTIRFGNTYHCDITTGGSLSSPQDCANGASSIALTDPTGGQVIYRLTSNQIERSINGGASYLKVTSSDVTIENLSFRVFGSAPYSSGNLYQPRAIIVIKGYAGPKLNSRSSFVLETTVSQRMVDSQ